MIASSMGAGSAAAGARFSPRNSAKILNPKAHIHIMPTRSVAKKIAAAPSPFAPLATLAYHGGPVMASGTRAIPIFWEPSKLQDGTSAAVNPSYNSLISQFLRDYGGNGLYGILTQYYQNPGPQFIVNSSGMTVAIVDTSAYPTAGVLGCVENGLVNCITDSQLTTEITKVVTAGSLPRDYSTFYPVFTAPMEESCLDSITCFWPNSLANPSWVYCAYHGMVLLGGQPVVYANMPYMDSNANSHAGCGGGAFDPNLNIPVDDETGVLSHEFDESITDPDGGGGWWDNSTGNEIGDVCNGSDALVNWTAADHQYSVQTEYSAVSDACLGGGPFGDNRLTLSAPNGAAGTNITVSGTGFNDSAVLLSWKFTDSAGTVTTVATPPTTDLLGSFAATTFAIPGGAAAGRGTIQVVGLTPDDAAAAEFTVGTATRKPDSLIGKAGLGPWTGNNVYNATGAGQSLKINVKRRKSYTFWAQIQDDGNISDTFSVKGTKAPAGFTIKYIVGTTNVTTTVQSGAYHPVLAAGSAFIMQITITVKSKTAVNKKFKDVILATSLAGATKDAVVETVTAK